MDDNICQSQMVYYNVKIQDTLVKGLTNSIDHLSFKENQGDADLHALATHSPARVRPRSRADITALSATLPQHRRHRRRLGIYNWS